MIQQPFVILLGVLGQPFLQIKISGQFEIRPLVGLVDADLRCFWSFYFSDDPMFPIGLDVRKVVFVGERAVGADIGQDSWCLMGFFLRGLRGVAAGGLDTRGALPRNRRKEPVSLDGGNCGNGGLAPCSFSYLCVALRSLSAALPPESLVE